MSWSTTARTINTRISHGTAHMPAPALVMRIAVILFGTGVTCVTGGWFSLLAGAITVVSGVVSLWELHDAAVECEQEYGPDEDQDTDEVEGSAA